VKWVPGDQPEGTRCLGVLDATGALLEKAGCVLYRSPLLPSPPFINALPPEQRRPAAIAALERAGCKSPSWDGFVYLWFTDRTHIAIDRCGRTTISLQYVDDPVLARYAADCFTVIQPWVDAISWGDN